MNLKASLFVGWMILVLAAAPCLATRIPSVTASTNMGSGFGTNIQNSVNGVGLSSLSLTAAHAGTSPTNSWVSASTLTGAVTFDLGGIFTVDSFSFWNQNGGGPGANGSTGIKGVAVSTSTDGITFTPLSGGPTSFAQVTVAAGASPEIFSFTPVSARFFRFTITSNHGDTAQTGFGEAGFNAEGPPPTPTPTPLPNVLTNGSFETGNYTGWIASDVASPFSPLTVRGSGFTTGFGFFSTAPTDGNFASVDGFDGAGPGNIRIAQDVVIPAGTPTLMFDYRAAWDMLNYPGSTQARTLNVIVQPSGGGPNLLSTNILTAPPGTVNLDTGNRMASVNLGAFAGQTVRVIIDQFIPESFTGPGLIQIDNLRLPPGSIPASRAPFDFDGDTKTDIGIFRPAPGEWWYQKSTNNQVTAAQFGQSTDKITPADYTGDGKSDIAFWRPSSGEWFILRSEDSTFFAFPFGAAGDIPAPADYDADGRADAAVFRPSSSTWFISNSGGSGTSILTFGISTDKPVVADYDGDAKADIAIWRAGPGEWWVRRSTNGSILAVQFGVTSDRPVQGDFTGDGKADIAFWRPADGNWFVVRSEDSSFFAFPFGSNGDVPVPGDYDGDGRQDAAVFRPSSATWFLNRSTAGIAIQQFGLSTDTPVPSAFVP